MYECANLQKGKKKAAVPSERRLGIRWSIFRGSAAARGAAGALLHACKHETLVVMEIDDGVRQHLVCAVLKKDLQPVMLERRVARLGGFGYVHSQ
jgi:hypothetical protein